LAVKSGFKQVIQSMAQFMAEPTLPTRREYHPPADIDSLPTGIRALDKAVEIGGLPHGQVTELVESDNGLSAGGGTLIASRIAARAQRQQQIVSIIDLNRGFDPWQAERCGLVAPQLLLSRPDTVFEAVSSLESAARHAALVVVMMGSALDLLAHVGASRRKTLLRRLRNIAHTGQSVILLITNPGKNDPFDPATYPPGFPLADIAAVRLWMQDETWSYNDGLATAFKASLTVIKNDFGTVGKGANVRVKLISP
jgi:hypothetical protein